MINLTTNTKSFSVEKGKSGGKSGSGSSAKVIKQIIYQGGGSESGPSVDVFTGATADNPGRQGLVPQPLAGQNTLFLKGNGLWEKVFQFIREDEEGNIYIDGKATKFGSPIYLKDIFSNQQDLAENLRKIEIHDNVQFDKSSDFLGESRFSNNVIFNRNQADGSGPNKVTVNADLEVNGKSNFKDDMTATNITVDYLTVTKLAHFFELVIDKVRATKGQIIVTDANAKIDYVEKDSVKGFTRLYWRADLEDQSNFSLNEFRTGDQILCQTFNRGHIVEENEHTTLFGAHNKYYWVVCSGVGLVKKQFLGQETHPYNFVEISDDDTVSPKDGEFLPEIGDEIVQLGNRFKTERQAAIIISAYNNAYLDKGIKAPAIVQYDGINDFQLEPHRLNVISKGLNRFMGSYLTPDGQTDIVDKIGNIQTITSNRFSEIQQTIDGITTTVSNNTTKIDTLTGKVTENATNISKLDQKADRIQAQVEQIQTGTSGDLTTITNSIANLQIKADEISSTVTQNTTKIDDLTGKVTQNTTNISNIDQKADRIQSTVTKIEGDYVTSSQLTQTSTEILAQVSDTYIKIGDDNITLGGNTIIKGSLTLTQNDQGFKLVGSDGVTEIMPKSIGTYDEFKASNTSTQNVVNSINCNGSQSTSDDILRFEGTLVIYLGERKKGDFIKCKFNSLTANVTNGWNGSSFTENFPISSTFSAKTGDSFGSLGTGGWTTISANQEFSHTFVSNITNAKIYVKFSGNTLYSRWKGNYDDHQGKPMPIPNALAEVNCTLTLPTTAHMLIGYDGWGANFGNNKTVYCGKEGFIASFGDNEFRITSEGISHNNMATTHTIIGSPASESPIVYEVKDPVDLVLCKSGYCKIRMPKTPYNGQTIKVLDKSPNETWIDFNGKYVCPADTQYESRSLNSNWACKGTYPRLFTYLDNTWYEEYMG